MRACAVCGEMNPDRARFCMKCGSPLPPPAEPEETRKTVTVVFCDVVGSTPLGERLDPESVRSLMTRFFERMRSILEHHGGTVEKYIGDAVMAVFGVPELHEDDALRAVRAAAQMRDVLAELNADLDPSWGVALRSRIGVNTGPVVVGDARGGPLVVGDAVNVAARLEAAADPGEILLGGTTYALVRWAVSADDGHQIPLRGKAQPVTAHRLLDVDPFPSGALRHHVSHSSSTRLASGGSDPHHSRAVPAELVEGLHPAFVGRAPQLQALRDAFERSIDQRTCELATVLGAAGVGKSRLAEEFTASIRDRARVIGGRCLPYGDGITFWPVAELVRDASGIATTDAPVIARQKIVSTVGDADDARAIVAALASISGFGDRSVTIQEIFWAVRRFLEILQEDRPLEVVFDDLQWAEPTFLDLIEYLAGRTRDARILLLCLARPEILDLRPGWPAQPGVTALVLDQLTEAETEDLIADLLGAPPQDRADATRIVAAAGGNPLFVEELLRMLSDDGLLARTGAGWHITGDMAHVPVPPSISALLSARLDRLSPGERSVLGIAAVIGKEFWWGAVADLLPDDERGFVGSRLLTLVRKGLIDPERTMVAGQDAFAFHHILVRDASYEALPKQRRALLHQRFAEWIELHLSERIREFEEVIGHHLEQACRYRRELGLDATGTATIAAQGAQRLASAGRRALARGDVTAAVNLLQRAAGLQPADAATRGALLPDLGEAMMQSGELANADRVLTEAIRIAESIGDRTLRAHAAITRLLLMESTDPKGFAEGAPGELARVMPLFEDGADDLGLARALRVQADLHWNRARYAAAGTALEGAIEHARAAGNAWEQAELIGQFTGAGVYGPMPVAQVAARCEAVLGEYPGDDVIAARVLRSLAALRAMQGEFGAARDLATRAAGILADLGLRLPAAFASETRGFVERLAGDMAAAESALRTGYDVIAEMQEQGYQATVAAMLAQVLVAQDRIDDAEPFIEEAAGVAAADDVATHVLVRAARGRVAAARGRQPEALALCREAVALAEATDDVNMHGDALLDLASVLAVSGDGSAAAAAAARAQELFSAKGNVVQAATAAALAARQQHG